MKEQLLPVVTTGLSTKTIENFAAMIVAAMQDGELSGEKRLLVAEQVSGLSKLIEKIKENTFFREMVLEELAKHPQSKATLTSGAKISPLEAGVKYAYHEDETWSKLNAQLKAREELLKNIPKGTVSVIEETGEMVHGVSKTSTSSYRVTFVKE